MAKRATAPALFSTALLDQVCPPSTVFAARNHYVCCRRRRVRDAAASRHRSRSTPHNQHEGGAAYQWAAQAEFLARFV